MATSEGASPSERMSDAFSKLAESAQSINETAGELAKPVASLQRSLQQLNLGVACWQKILGGSDEGDNYWSNDVGYARVNGTWCIALRTVAGHLQHPDAEDVDMWPFNEAPLHLRVKAVEKLPDLIESLVEATNAANKRLKAKVGPTTELAAAASAAISGKRK